MLKLFLTGDNHIGLKYAGHEQSAVLAAKRISAFENMVYAANEEECDLFVIAGDLFENTYSVAKRDIQLVLKHLSAFRGTVVVLPGNHDYYDKDSKLWQTFETIVKEYDNILLLSQYRPYELYLEEERVVLYPAPCTSVHSAPGENNLGWIKQLMIADGSAYLVGIAHGAVEGETIDNEGQYFLMKRSELESIPVDVWLLGHTHVPFPRGLKQDEFTACEPIFNAGTHVQTDVSCNTEGKCFVIEIDENKKVRAKEYASGNLWFYRKHISVSAGMLQSKISEALAHISPSSVVELIISGAVSEEEYEDRAEILENALTGYLEVSYYDGGLSKLITKELIEAEFSEMSFAASLLKALLDEPKEAQLLYEVLRELKEGKQ